MELFQAHREWRRRPDDERFRTIHELVNYLEMRQARTLEQRVVLPDIAGVDFDLRTDDPVLVTGSGRPLRLTNRGFKMLCREVGASPDFLAKLPPENVAADLTFLLKNRDQALMQIDDLKAREKAMKDFRKPKKLLLIRDGEDALRIRHIGSQRYGRIYDLEVARWVRDRLMNHFGFTVPVSRYNPKSGLYAGEHDCFFLLEDLTRGIEVKRPNGTVEILHRALMVRNSEVGLATFEIIGCLYQMICDNHIIWGAEQIEKLSVRHVGEALERAHREMFPQIQKYLDEGTDAETKLFHQAMNTRIAAKPDEALAFLTEKKFSKRVAQEALVRAANDPNNEGLDPLSFLAVVNGLTSQARDLSNADDRYNLEYQARKLMNLLS